MSLIRFVRVICEVAKRRRAGDQARWAPAAALFPHKAPSNATASFSQDAHDSSPPTTSQSSWPVKNLKAFCRGNWHHILRFVACPAEHTSADIFKRVRQDFSKKQFAARTVLSASARQIMRCALPAKEMSVAILIIFEGAVDVGLTGDRVEKLFCPAVWRAWCAMLVRVHYFFDRLATRQQNKRPGFSSRSIAFPKTKMLPSCSCHPAQQRDLRSL